MIARRPPLGLFVGGRGSRMGGVDKGLLNVGGSTVAGRMLERARALDIEMILVGRSGAYASLGCRCVADDRPDAGPLGGLVALLADAREGSVLAVACDMPHVSAALLSRLMNEQRDAAVLAPRTGGRWEPLLARYDVQRVLPVARRRLDEGYLSLQPLLDELGALELDLNMGERAELADWDSPGDLR